MCLLQCNSFTRGSRAMSWGRPHPQLACEHLSRSGASHRHPETHSPGRNSRIFVNVTSATTGEFLSKFNFVLSPIEQTCATVEHVCTVHMFPDIQCTTHRFFTSICNQYCYCQANTTCGVPVVVMCLCISIRMSLHVHALGFISFSHALYPDEFFTCCVSP